MKLIIILLIVSAISFSNSNNRENKNTNTTKNTENEVYVPQESVPLKKVGPKYIKKIEPNESVENKKNLKNTEWQLVWSDEFDGNRLDESKWSYWENDNPWKSGNYIDENGNLIDQYGFKVKHFYLRDNVRLENGYLVIELKKEDNKTVNINGVQRKILYSSGAVHTKDKFTIKYGKIEMRAAMPKGVGVWPAFWTWPADYSQAEGKPAREEIDIFEIYGDNLKRVTGTAHALKPDGTYASNEAKDLTIKKNEDLTRFNTYAVEWDEKEIRWYFNGRKYKTLTMKKVKKNSENTFNLEHFLMINVALQNKTGEDGDVDFPTDMKVDYVRVYKK